MVAAQAASTLTISLEVIMARSCACEKLLDTIEHDPRFLLAGPAASMIWLKLVRIMARVGDPLVLSLGSVFGSWNEVAFGLRVSETELQTHLETLAARDLVLMREDGLTLPDWIGIRDRRADAARANGRKGGRPPKNAPVQGQTSMMLPIAGGAERKPTETKIETQPETQSISSVDAACTTTFFKEKVIEVSSSTSEPVWVSLGRELASLLRLDPNDRHRFNIVKSWLDAGATAEWLRDVFTEVMSRRTPPASPSFAYLDKVIRPKLRNELGVSREPQVARALTPEQQRRRIEWDAIYDRWISEGARGPKIPDRRTWIYGEFGDRARWLLYRSKGAAAFREAA
jgi:hypothetical protein